MGKTSIEWTAGDDGTPGSVWNPVRGCSRISPGCGGANHQGGCYAEKIAARFSGPGQPFEGFAERTAHGGRWTGKMAVAWDMVDQPIRWRKPRRIFANSMSDLFHKDLPRDEVAIIYGTAIAAVHLRGHTFQILTKRADHMRELLSDEEFWEIANAHASSLVLEHTDPLNRRSDDARATCGEYGPDAPPPGIWLGVSTEDQPRADERIPDLLATPATTRFLSVEPMLGGVALRQEWLPCSACRGRGWYLARFSDDHQTACKPCLEAAEALGITVPVGHMAKPGPRIDWVIAGGESGPRARPMHPDWARSLRDQCAAAGVPFFFKQWGEWVPDLQRHIEIVDTSNVGTYWPDGTTGPGHAERKGGYGKGMHRVGKKAAGAELDGKQHREFPT
jgi:protein gp37